MTSRSASDILGFSRMCWSKRSRLSRFGFDGVVVRTIPALIAAKADPGL